MEFAKLPGVSKQYVCDLEHGRRFVSPKAAAEYAKKLGYSSQQFVRLCLQDLVDRDGLDLIIDVQCGINNVMLNIHVNYPKFSRYMHTY